MAGGTLERKWNRLLIPVPALALIFLLLLIVAGGKQHHCRQEDEAFLHARHPSIFCNLNQPLSSLLSCLGGLEASTTSAVIGCNRTAVRHEEGRSRIHPRRREEVRREGLTSCRQATSPSIFLIQRESRTCVLVIFAARQDGTTRICSLVIFGVLNDEPTRAYALSHHIFLTHQGAVCIIGMKKSAQ